MTEQHNDQPEQPDPVDTKAAEETVYDADQQAENGEKDPEAGPAPEEGENQDSGETPIPDHDDDPSA